jgi:hypothetical protein
MATILNDIILFELNTSSKHWSWLVIYYESLCTYDFRPVAIRICTLSPYILNQE